MNIPTVQITNILFPTDLSDNAKYAFAYAVSLANLYKAKITLLHVLPEEQRELEIHLSGYIKTEKWEEIRNAHYQQTRETLTGKIRHHALTRSVQDQLADSDSASGPADEIVIEYGKPAKEILHQIEVRNCDLIVMGSRGNSTLAGAIIGGITERVLRRAHVPVLVIRLPEDV
jgi:nucleotide-binding universal stress UspA family protein